MTGSGQKDDPKRPEHTPNGAAIGNATAPGQQKKASEIAQPGAQRPGIIAWRMTPADNNAMAIVHLVAADHKALEPILNDKRATMRVFEIGRDKPEDIERELRKHKKDFSLENFQVVVQ